MLFADFGSDSDLSAGSQAINGTALSHPPMMPMGFLPVEVDDGPPSTANGRAPLRPQLRPMMRTEPRTPYFFGVFGDDVSRLPTTSPRVGTRTAPAPQTAFMSLPSAAVRAASPAPAPQPSQPFMPVSPPPATDQPADPYAQPATAKTHWGWWALAGAGALGAIGGILLLVGKRKRR
jgi:hypothetical protein